MVTNKTASPEQNRWYRRFFTRNSILPWLFALWKPVERLIDFLGNVEFVSHWASKMTWGSLGHFLFDWGWAITTPVGFAWLLIISNPKRVSVNRKQTADPLAPMRFARQEAANAAHSKITTQFIAMDSAFGVQKELQFQFRAYNFAMSDVRVTGNVKGHLACFIESNLGGWWRIEPMNIPMDGQAILTMHYDLTESVMKTLAYYAEDTTNKQTFAFDFSGMEIECEIFVGAPEHRAFWLRLPNRTEVMIPDHPAYEQVRAENVSRL